MKVKLEQFQVLEYKKGQIYKTKKVKEEWFDYKDIPETYEIKDGLFWVWTSEMK